jgi:acylphosphatase
VCALEIGPLDDEEMDKAVDVRITGVVQGVSFRAYAREEARRLGVAGWMRNDRDGSVVGHFEGPDEAVDGLVAWCEHGPTYAEVERVDVTDAAATGAEAFVIG